MSHSKNQEHAGNARAAAILYAALVKDESEDMPTVVTDLMADLCHLGVELGEDPLLLVEKAIGHHSSELIDPEGLGPQMNVAIYVSHGQPKMKPVIKVWLGVISNEHGQYTRVHATMMGLEKSIADYCREWWVDVAGLHDEEGNKLPEEPTGLSDKAAQDMYFSAHQGEFLEIFGDFEIEP